MSQLAIICGNFPALKLMLRGMNYYNVSGLQESCAAREETVFNPRAC